LDKQPKTGVYKSMISVIVPSYNEPKIHDLVNEIEQEIGPAQIVIYNDRYGKGKGYAIREALEQATGDYYIFIDGDRDIPPREIFKIIFYLNEYDIVVGRKALPRKLKRKLLTFLSRIWIWLLFRIEVDTQTGIKGFNYKPEWKTDGWAFDIEILYKARKDKKTMQQIPIHATVSDGKSFKDILSTLIDTIKIRMGL